MNYLLFIIYDTYHLSFYSCYRVHQGELHVKRIKIEKEVATRFYGN